MSEPAQHPWGPGPETGLSDSENARRFLAFHDWFIPKDREEIEETRKLVVQLVERDRVKGTAETAECLAAMRHVLEVQLDGLDLREKYRDIAKARLEAALAAEKAP